MAEYIREKRCSAVELVQAHLTKIERFNPKLNAFVEVSDERALQDAKAADLALSRGEKIGPLHGVPLSVKSSIDVQGLRIEAGSKLRAGYVAGTDAPWWRGCEMREQLF